jgi:chromosome segregation ATPase
MQVDDMRKDLKFKERLLNDAESTAAKLQVEVDARNMDLEKIKTLETRIEGEMITVAEGINKMEDDMANKFTKVDMLTAGFEDEKRRLTHIKILVNTYKNALSKQTTYHAVKHDTRKNQIMQSDVYNRLNEIEKRLIGNESQIYAIQQYIEQKGAESNY